MAKPAVKVELGVNVGVRDPNAFILDNAIRGVLNNTQYTLSGDAFFDITDRLVSLSTARGKNQALERIDAGQLNIVVDNSDRLFDPLYEDGFFFGQLIPGKELRVSCNGLPVIYAFINDLNISYEPSKRSVVSFEATDALTNLTKNNLPEVLPDVELSGARITRILDLPEVDWPSDRRSVDAGNSFMSDTEISEGTQAISYLQLVATSEAGEVFVSKDGKFVFKARNSPPGKIVFIFTDEPLAVIDPEDIPPPGSDLFVEIPFNDLSVVYGTEELYNRIILTNDFPLFPEEAFAEDAQSQLVYGPRSYTVNGLLNNDPQDLDFLADFLLARFKEPQYRFNSLSVILDTLNEKVQGRFLELEIGNIVKVKFTPSEIPPAIEQFARIIGISHDWSNNEKRVNLAIERLDFRLFVLNNSVLGVLDENRLSY
jgi:hypothetical protein